MGRLIASQNIKNLEVTAIVYPVCVCGKPWKDHGDCGGYTPSRQIEDLGSIAFRNSDRISNLLFKVEQFIRNIRLRRIRR